MTSRDFCYWLQGHLEIQDGVPPQPINLLQVQIIKRHLNMVFKHEIDPSMGDDKEQNKLNAIHPNIPDHMRPGSDPSARC